MERLERLLQDISQRERVEALAYYNDYFDDAGEENEQEVISSLGSPEKVAATIKEGLGEKPKEEDGNTITTSGEGNHRTSGQSTDWGKIILIVLLCLVLSPILVPAGGAALSIILAIPAAFFGVFIAVGAGGIGLAIAGVVLVIVGIGKLFISAAVGLSVLGVGFLLLGIGTLGIIAAVWIAWKVIPWIIRGIVGLFRGVFDRKGGQTA
jgi:uncharacterized membrane protein